MEEGSYMEMDMVQIKGVDSTVRDTKAELAEGAKLIVRERLMTHGSQSAVSNYAVSLNGENASADVISRSVARDASYQKFDSRIIGNAPCSGHTAVSYTHLWVGNREYEVHCTEIWRRYFLSL